MTASEEAEIAGKRKPRAQTTGSTHNFKEIVQMCAKNFAHIKKNTTNVVFFSGAADQT